MESLGGSDESSQDMRFLLRELIRQKINHQRKEKRDALLVGRRHIEVCGFDVEKLNPPDIKALTLRIKKKQGGREGCYKDLTTLQAVLSDSCKKYGEAFARIDGAIAALVRDVSGHDSSLQLRATYCCANLAAAGSDIGLKVAKAVTPYLMTHLQGMNQILLEASLWAVGSLAGSGLPAFKVLEVQGIYPQLINIMHRYHISSPISPLQEKPNVKLQENRIIEATLYATAHCVSTGLQNNSKSSDIEAVAVASIPLLSRVDTYALPRLVYLFFVLSCSESSDSIFLKSNFVLKMILLLDESLMAVNDKQNDLNTQEFAVPVITAVIRVLGNVCSSDAGRSLLESISTIACPVISHLMKTLTNLPSHVLKETMWFVIQLLQPYSEWINGIIHVSDCPWTPLTHMINLVLEQQSKKMSLSNVTLPEETFL